MAVANIAAPAAGNGSRIAATIRSAAFPKIEDESEKGEEEEEEEEKEEEEEEEEAQTSTNAKTDLAEVCNRGWQLGGIVAWREAQFLCKQLLRVRLQQEGGNVITIEAQRWQNAGRNKHA